MRFNNNHSFLEHIYAEHHIIMACLADTWEREGLWYLPTSVVYHLWLFCVFCASALVMKWTPCLCMCAPCCLCRGLTFILQNSYFSMIDLDRAGTLSILIVPLGTVWLSLLLHLVWLSSLSLSFTGLNCLRYRNHAFFILVFLKAGTNYCSVLDYRVDEWING